MGGEEEGGGGGKRKRNKKKKKKKTLKLRKVTSKEKESLLCPSRPSLSSVLRLVDGVEEEPKASQEEEGEEEEDDDEESGGGFHLCSLDLCVDDLAHSLIDDIYGHCEAGRRRAAGLSQGRGGSQGGNG